MLLGHKTTNKETLHLSLSLYVTQLCDCLCLTLVFLRRSAGSLFPCPLSVPFCLSLSDSVSLHHFLCVFFSASVCVTFCLSRYLSIFAPLCLGLLLLFLSVSVFFCISLSLLVYVYLCLSLYLSLSLPPSASLCLSLYVPQTTLQASLHLRHI